MSKVMNENVTREMEKRGIDLTATLDNIIKQFPDLIVYTKTSTDVPVNDGYEKNTDINNDADNGGNKEQEYHKPGNNHKDYENSNKHKCDCTKCENECKDEEERDDERSIAGCVVMGELNPETALILKILEGIDAINRNIYAICNMLDKNASGQIGGVAELKTCKIHKGVSKKQLAKLLNSERDNIIKHIDEKFAALAYQLFRGDAILPADPALIKNEKKKK